MNPWPPFVLPSPGSTAAFLLIVVGLCWAWLWALRRAWPARKERAVAWGVACLMAVLVISATLASSGVLARTIGTPYVMGYVVGCNALMLGLGVSVVGKRISEAVPLFLLIAIHGFRLPLELVLHEWYRQGTLPIQMTYSGDNWDIVTGIAALVVAAILPRVGARTQRRLGAAFTLLGLGLLVRVVSVAMRSLPGPLRTYPSDPPVLLPFYAPYTWIVPMCVGGALFAHVVVVRWLWAHRRLAS